MLHSAFVPMVFMLVVKMTVMEIVNMVAVLNSLVTAALTMFMVVMVMHLVFCWLDDSCLVPVPLVFVVDMTIVQVVHMVTMLDSFVTATSTVLVVMMVVNVM